MNDNQSDFNALQRTKGNDPYAANTSVLGAQYKITTIYNQNRQMLNQAQLQNLGIYDQQMIRQEEAKIRTLDKNTARIEHLVYVRICTTTDLLQMVLHIT